MQTTYRSGQWFLVVLPGALVALPPDVSPAIVTRLWERMTERRTLATVVDVLAGGVGGDFASLPSFVAAVREGADLRIALRGDVSADVSTSTGPQHFSGAELTTWSERFVADASRLEIAVGAGDRDESLPVRDGVVRASSAVADFASAAAIPITGHDSASVTGRGPGDSGPEPDAPEPERDAPEPDAPEPEPEAPEPEPEAPEPEPDLPEAAAAAPDVTIIPSEVTLAPSSEDADQLWGATVHSVPSPAVPVAPPQIAGDHDGATISVAELRALREHAPPAVDAPTAVFAATSAAAGRIRVSTGQTVTLDRTVIIGRRPRSTRASGANLPHLVAVDSPQQDISRSHLEIRPEGDTVVVIDLHTTNGSTLLRAGADPVRLHPGEQTLVLSGDVVDLGDGVEVFFEDLP